MTRTPPAERFTFASDEAKWNALVARDRRADGRFVYAVRTTGVFCRPSCGSRRPVRTNVSFFDAPREAIRAGYRPCRRCGGLPGRPVEAVRRACEALERADEPPALEELAREAGLSTAHFHRLFAGTLGVTPKAYANAVRTRRLQDGLVTGSTVTQAIHAAGYRSGSRAYEDSSKVLGMTPTQYRNGANGVRVRYAVSRCSLGWLLVAATERGVCFTSLGDEPAPLIERLLSRFPNAEELKSDRQLAGWVRQVVELIDAPGTACDLPLDIRGTAFQRQVWEALQKIPAGQTATYTEIARKVGRPKAVRAVGNACGANPVAPMIPCHRVLASGGTLGGYGFGLERKKKLLERELAK